MKNNRFLKTVFGIVAFIIGGIITILAFKPMLLSFITSETVLDFLQITIHILLAVLNYRLAVQYLLKPNNDYYKSITFYL